MATYSRPLTIAIVCSILLHIALLLGTIFGLPGLDLTKPEVQPSFMVDIELPRVEISNPPKAKGTPDAPTTTPNPATNTPPKPTPAPPPPPPPPAAKAEPEPPKPEPHKPEVKPEPAKPEPAKPAEPEDEIESLKKLLEKKAAEKKAFEDKKLAETKKQEEAKKAEQAKQAAAAEAKKAEQKKPDDPFADNILKTLSKQSPQQDTAKGEADGVAKVRGDAKNKADLPVGFSDLDLIRRQIEPCWNVPSGARYAENLVVSIKIELDQTGAVRTATVVDSGRASSDPAYRAAAESARRAVWDCSPLKLPPDKYDAWKSITMTFDPRQVLGF
jgi:membrane protein involved in colicin uptake